MNVKCSQGHASFCPAASLVFGLAFIQGRGSACPRHCLSFQYRLGQAVTRPTVNPGCAHLGQDRRLIPEAKEKSGEPLFF